MITLTEERYRELLAIDTGLCLACGEERECTEPDAEGYKCPACGELSFMGLELAMVAGEISIVFPEDP